VRSAINGASAVCLCRVVACGDGQSQGRRRCAACRRGARRAVPLVSRVGAHVAQREPGRRGGERDAARGRPVDERRGGWCGTRCTQGERVRARHGRERQAARRGVSEGRGRRGSGAKGRAARPGDAREQRKERGEGRRREEEGKGRKEKGGKEKKRGGKKRKENGEKEKEKKKWWKEKGKERKGEKKGCAIFAAATAAGRPRARDIRTLREEKRGRDSGRIRVSVPGSGELGLRQKGF
jgi:hypothetical protein